MARALTGLSLAALLLSCSGPRLVYEEIAGCYAIQWRTIDDTTYLSGNPDSIMLSVAPYTPPTEIAQRAEIIDFRKAHLVRQQRESFINGYGEVIWEDTWWWWRLEGDSITFATGHDAADLMGFRAAPHGDRLSGVGVWENDYGPGAKFSVTGRRIVCPEQGHVHVPSGLRYKALHNTHLQLTRGLGRSTPALMREPPPVWTKKRAGGGVP